MKLWLIQLVFLIVPFVGAVIATILSYTIQGLWRSVRRLSSTLLRKVEGLPWESIATKRAR